MTEDLNLDLVSLALVRDYLQLHGWQPTYSHKTSPGTNPSFATPFFISARKPSSKPEVFSLKASNGAMIEVALPGNQDSSNYFRDLKDIIVSIAEVEGKSRNQVLEDIHNVGFDIMRHRIPISNQDRGTIRLNVVTEYLKATKDVLSAAATTEIEPNSFFKRTLKEALSFADHCRFGHTFRGSFGFTIESAVPPNFTPYLFPGDDQIPFERRVVRRLAKGLELARTAIREDDLAPLIESSDSALGANGYEALADLVEETPRKEITFDFSFSPYWKENLDASTMLSIDLESQHANAFRSAAKQMREPSVEVPAQIDGLITDLSLANPSSLDDARNRRRIIVLWSSEQFGDIRVAANVSAPTYLKALSLHREASPITLNGMLRRVGRGWSLTIPNEDISGTESEIRSDAPSTTLDI